MNKLISLALLVFSIALIMPSCTPKTTKPVTETPTPPPPPPAEEEPKEEPKVPDVVTPKPRKLLVASIKKTGCFGKCPTYEAQLFSDGQVLYKGTAHVDRIGTYEAVPGMDKADEVMRKAMEINFFDFESRYPKDGPLIADASNTITFIRSGRLEKEVFNNHDAPKELRDFESYLVDFFNGLKYVKVAN